MWFVRTVWKLWWSTFDWLFSILLNYQLLYTQDRHWETVNTEKSLYMRHISTFCKATFRNLKLKQQNRQKLSSEIKWSEKEKSNYVQICGNKYVCVSKLEIFNWIAIGIYGGLGCVCVSNGRLWEFRNMMDWIEMLVFYIDLKLKNNIFYDFNVPLPFRIRVLLLVLFRNDLILLQSTVVHHYPKNAFFLLAAVFERINNDFTSCAFIKLAFRWCFFQPLQRTGSLHAPKSL